MQRAREETEDPNPRPAVRRATMEPRYTPLEQWLFLEVAALNDRVARAEEERVEFADKLKVLEDVVWKLLRNQGGYVTEVVEAVMEQEEVEDETGILTRMIAEWDAEQEEGQRDWEGIVDEFFELEDLFTV